MEAKRLSEEKGLFVGISSGENFLAAKQIRKKFENIITIFPDSSDRYTNLYSIKFKAKAGG